MSFCKERFQLLSLRQADPRSRRQAPEFHFSVSPFVPVLVPAYPLVLPLPLSASVISVPVLSMLQVLSLDVLLVLAPLIQVPLIVVPVRERTTDCNT